MNSPALPPLPEQPTTYNGLAGMLPVQANPDVFSDYTFDELRELPLGLQLGADFSALD